MTHFGPGTPDDGTNHDQPRGDQPPWDAPAQPGYGTAQPGYGTAQPGYGTAQPGYGAPDVLASTGSPTTAPSPARRGLLVALVAIVVVLLAAGTVVGVRAYSFLSGGGPQPEGVLPADTVAFAKVDLDPAANQKLALAALLRKFPELTKRSGESGSDPKDALAGTFLGPGNQFGLDYRRDVKPWLGSRLAAAAVPDKANVDGVDAVLVLNYTDATKMRRALDTASRRQPFGYAVAKDYVLISDTAVHAKHVLAGAKQHTLAEDNDSFAGDRKTLDGDQIALGWVDIGAAYRIAPAGQGDSVATGVVPTGRLVVGLHATTTYAELQGRAHGLQVGSAARLPATDPVHGYLGDLPTDTFGAVELSGLGDWLATLYSEVTAKDPSGGLFGFDTESAAQNGLKLPEDIRTVFGDDTLAVVGGSFDNPNVAVRTHTADPARASAVIRRLTGDELPITVQRNADGITVTTDPRMGKQISTASSPRLGDDQRFKTAAPDATGAGLVAYVNVGAIVDADASGVDRTRLEHLAAVGLTVRGGREGSFRLRVTTR